jgi:hypothetical protein
MKKELPLPRPMNPVATPERRAKITKGAPSMELEDKEVV